MKKTKKIGDFSVNPIGIGGFGIGGGWMTSSSRNDDENIKAIRHSIKKGQNHIDTAEAYGSGHSEEVIGEAIKGLDRNKLFIATKVWRNNASTTSVPKAAKSSLSRLGLKYVDLLYIHACWDEKNIHEYINGLNKAHDLGYAKSIGVSNFNLKQLKKAVSMTKHPIVALQNHYNVLHQHEVDSEIKSFCKKNKITIVAYSPLENCKQSDEIKKLAKKYKKSPAQIALNWLISQDNVVTIPKSTDNKHIEENLEAMDFEMSSGDINVLNSLL